MLYEVEVSSLLKPAGYKRLYKYLEKNSKLINKEEAETVVLAASQGDLRLVRANDKVKLICKTGDVFQEVRAEMEVLVDIKDADKLEEIFLALGFKIACQYKKKRVHFRWQGTKISLDNIKGFGLMIEMEKLVDARLVKKSEIELREKLQKLLDSLEIPTTPVVKLNKMYRNYLDNWQVLIKKRFTSI